MDTEVILRHPELLVPGVSAAVLSARVLGAAAHPRLGHGLGPVAAVLQTLAAGTALADGHA